MNMLAVCLVVATLALAHAQHVCPNDKRGQFQDPVQCDKYYECVDGVSTEKLCPDGLVFDETIRLKNKCDQPFNVDCGERTQLQPPRGNNDKCPRKNGFFAHPDDTICHIFFNCIDGDAIEVVCTAGLHFDEYSGTCVWPDSAQRSNCQSRASKEEGAFNCPEDGTKKVDAQGQTVVHPKYPHEEDCQKFYVCLNGHDKRSLGCEAGKVYNTETEQCDAPENVAGCEDWYKEDAETKSRRKK